MWSRIPYKWRRKISGWKISLRRKVRKYRLRYRFFQAGLYDFSQKANPWLRVFSILLTILLLISLFIPVAFSYDALIYHYAEIVDQALLVGFGLHFLLRLFLSVNRIDFLKSRWLEGIAASFALLIGLDLWFSSGAYLIFFLECLGLSNPQQMLLIAIQLYLVLLIVIKIVQIIPDIIAGTENPARLVLVSFLSVIFAGLFLLMLPASTVDGEGLTFVDSLFMATSAVCVTGLIVVDTATHLTMFGQSVILVLIQLGGIGVITFATFLALYLTGGIGLTQRSTLRDVVQQRDVRVVSSTLKRIILLTLSVELIGAISYFISWSEEIPVLGERVFFSIFHAISAFCNAGFSVYTNSLADPFNSTALDINIITMVLIILGGLGFATIWELLSRRRSSRNRLTVHSLIILRMTVFLILAGWAVVLLLEWDGVLSDFDTGEKLLASLFQSVTTRTAGFNTVDTGALEISTGLIIIVLMAIGGSPSSTAGGVKTTTAYVLFMSMLSNIRGKRRLEIAHRTIPGEVVFRAISSVLLAFFVLMICTVLLVIFEDFAFFDILFEQVSAFMTVGLSRGITGNLSDPGKIVLVISMFMGRVGLLTFAIAFATKSDDRNYRYPEESVMVA